MPTDDEVRLKLLRQVQALREDLDKVENLAQARVLKVRLVALHEASIGEGVGRLVGSIVDEFFTLAKASIVESYGSAAWDDPETSEQTKSRTGTLTDLELTKLREFFERLPDQEPIPEHRARQVTSALVELQRLRAQARKTR
jgi:hypothetical protein